MPLMEGPGSNSLSAKLEELKSRNREVLTNDEALELAIEASQLSMQFMQIARSPQERKQTKTATKYLVEQAERVGASKLQNDIPGENLLDLEPLEPLKHLAISPTVPVTSRSPLHTHASQPRCTQRSYADLSNVEKRVLLNSSKLDGCKYPIWESKPGDDEFDLKAGSDLFIDDHKMRLSAEQEIMLDGWKRPSEALLTPYLDVPMSFRESITSSQPSMDSESSIDLVQDAATDCSIVASLSSGIARAQKGFDNTFTANLFPRNKTSEKPIISPNGKYIVRLNFNGSARRVVVDDLLPVSRTDRLLHVVDRHNPLLLWPAILEKAYLKVRGGYDFPGSNSCTDIWIMTGWIPEQVLLQHEETDLEHLWHDTMNAFTNGNVLVTLGTGEMTEKSELASGLAGFHDYAVIDCKEEAGQRHLLIKNPWLNGPLWSSELPTKISSDPIGERSKSASQEASGATSQRSDSLSGDLSLERKVSKDADSGSFWMSFNLVTQNFDFMYLNWNPSLFSHREDIHFDWDLTTHSKTTRSPPGSLFGNPQYVFRSESGGSVSLLLSKHLKDDSSISVPNSVSPTEQFISLYVFSNSGRRVRLSKGALKQSAFVDCPQILLRFDAAPRTVYTIAAAEQGVSSIIQSFSMSVFANSSLFLGPAEPFYPDHTSIRGTWNTDTSGGSVELPSYGRNPQFNLHLPGASRVCVICETSAEDIKIHVKLVHGKGQRVMHLKAQDIIVDSGSYRKHYAFAETSDELPSGSYTLICSTYQPTEFGDFILHVETNVNCTLNAVGREGAGRLRLRLADASFSRGVRRVGAPLTVQRLAKVNFVAYAKNSNLVNEWLGNPESKSSAMRLVIQRGHGIDRNIMLASGNGAYSDPQRGLRTEDINLTVDRMRRGPDVWLVLERMMGPEADTKPEERVEIEYHTDSTGPPMWVGVWREFDE